MANKRKFKGEGMTYEEAMVHYQNYDMKVEDIAKAVGVCTRQIEREAKKRGICRSFKEATHIAGKFRDYSHQRKVSEMRKNKNKRKSLPLGLRFELLNKNPRCAICGRTAATGVLEIDHIDSDPSNNDLSNLQVLCADCNMGKYWSEQLKKEKNIK